MYPSCICLPRIYPCMYVSMYLLHMYNVKCLKITGFILSLLQTRRLKPRCPGELLPPQAPGRGLPASSSSGGSRCSRAGGRVPPISASVSTWLLLWVCVSSSVSSQDTVVGRRAPLTQVHLISHLVFSLI